MSTGFSSCPRTSRLEKRFGADGESSEAKRAKQETEHVFDINLLQKFYREWLCSGFIEDELFPAKEFVEWLTYAYSDDPSQREDFRKRELSFTLSNEVYMRYRGFSDAVCFIPVTEW